VASMATAGCSCTPGREGPRPGLLGGAAHGAGRAHARAGAGPAAGTAWLMAERPQAATRQLAPVPMCIGCVSLCHLGREDLYLLATET
jgi:hypothetical protein